nr:helix-turn-helix transcriptional regulator [uncultured Duganella sp.]
MEKPDASGVSTQTQKCEAQLMFAANVRRFRKAQLISQEKLAEYAGLHTNYISSVERGERNISICNIERIARGLGTSMAALLTPPALPAMGGKGGEEVDETEEWTQSPLPAMGVKAAKKA